MHDNLLGSIELYTNLMSSFTSLFIFIDFSSAYTSKCTSLYESDSLKYSKQF